ncbi:MULTISPECIES: hypothetical protein [Larkinella]|jgi:hypothetical protein|uniref:hypothetical protein n=1 Tax=Larkinella TaxID=332157 RepID=UPI00148608B3|nr:MULTISPECIES: hypothetical protein [Larkinella]
MMSQLFFQRPLQTRSTRFANYYNQYGKPARKKPRPERPDWLVVLTFVAIALTILFS